MRAGALVVHHVVFPPCSSCNSLIPHSTAVLVISKHASSLPTPPINLKFKDPFGGAGRLVIYHVKQKDIGGALNIFYKNPDAAGATTLMSHFTQQCALSSNNSSSALDNIFLIYNSLIGSGTLPNHAVLATFINACRKCYRPEEAIKLTNNILQLKHGFDEKCYGSLAAACVEAKNTIAASKLVDCIPLLTFKPSEIHYAQLIKTFCNNNKLDAALNLVYSIMPNNHILPSPQIFSMLITCCAQNRNIVVGRRLHIAAQDRGLSSNIIIQNALMNMYLKCDNIDMACEIFDPLVRDNVADAVSWSTMISGFGLLGYKQEALQLFLQLLKNNVKIVERQIITATFNACSSSGQKVYSKENDWVMDVQYASQLFDVLKYYASALPFNNIDYAILMKAFSREGQLEKTFEVFELMRSNNITGSTHACCSLLAVCTDAEHLRLGQRVYEYIHTHNIPHSLELFTAIINMFTRCNYPQMALKVWLQISSKYAATLDAPSFRAALSASAECVAGEATKHIHSLIEKSGIQNVILESCLINAYASCSNLEAALDVFQKVRQNRTILDTVTWTAALKAYSTLGLGLKAQHHFQEMLRNGVAIDVVTVCVLLNAYSHSGLVAEALQFYQTMGSRLNIKPTIELQNCIVDVLVRANRLQEAEEFIFGSIECPNLVTWITFTAGCQVHGNVEKAKIGVENALKLKPDHAPTLILKSNIYAASGDFVEVGHIRDYMHKYSIKRQLGHSWIEVNNTVHSFFVHDKSHPDTAKIYAEIHKMRQAALKEGYVPHTCHVMHDIPEEQKEETLWFHCEKLAVAYGIITTPPHTPLVVKKNLRMCQDCHEATKYVSKIYQRKISVADAARWHIFQNGTCSCKDYF